eukprot:2552225-Prymnesium_polylepis.1
MCEFELRSENGPEFELERPWSLRSCDSAWTITIAPWLRQSSSTSRSSSSLSLSASSVVQFWVGMRMHSGA